jgi:hypothetical protein
VSLGVKSKLESFTPLGQRTPQTGSSQKEAGAGGGEDKEDGGREETKA